jgi:creatinine amidohydrolase
MNNQMTKKERTMNNQQDKFFPVMEHMTVKTVREYLERRHSIILPVGVTEQHGYHLPLCTDALIAGRIAQIAGKQLDILVGPTILQSFSGGGLPGTINISPAVMSLVISDTLMSLVAQGFRNFYLFLNHSVLSNQFSGRSPNNYRYFFPPASQHTVGCVHENHFICC